MMEYFEVPQPEHGGNSLKIQSITKGVVKENWDDKHQGMVKVEYSLGEAGKNVSGWMPVMSIYAGKDFGFYILPEVGTEVVIGFELGDRNCPIVLGTLWNKVNTIPDKTADKNNSIKLLKTKAGCLIRASEEKGKERIEIQTPGELKVVMDDEKQSIVLSDKDGKNQFLLDAKSGQITVSADKKLLLKAGGKEALVIDSNQASLKAGKIEVEAQQSLKAKGQNSKYEGASVEVKANGTLKLEASGITQVKGSMLKLN